MGNPITYDLLKPHIILQGITGSTAHGLALEGSDDRDELGVCIEPIELAMVLGQPFEQLIYRTAAVREGKHDARSQAGDLDLTIFSLRKFCRLAASGNPSILLLFFTPQITYLNALGGKLLEMAPLFMSKEAGKRFLGYMHGQRQRLVGERGQKRVKRPELEEAYGYDTKYAMHVLRLGYQGVELLRTGQLTLPMLPGYREGLMEVRCGKWPIERVLRVAESLEQETERWLKESKLPDHPDRPAIEKWMRERYLYWWSAQRPLWTFDGEKLNEKNP